MAIRIVQSKQNPRVKELRSALLRPSRSSSDPVALEGIHLLEEAIASEVEIETIFVTHGSENLLSSFKWNPARRDSIEIIALPMDVLTSAVTTESPQPVAALVRPRIWDWPDLLSSTALIVVLAGIQDPGNLGTILRSAEAFGATGVVCLSGSVSPWNPKAMRASAGSIFRIPLIWATEKTCLARLKDFGVRTLAAMAHDADPLNAIDLSVPTAIFIGSEGNGLSPELAAQCNARITIPMPGATESLNAAVAASVLLYEASRQRTHAPASKKQRRP
jgi:RNA methyltransferase, TrmH family